jgi:hypothetical protein
LTGPPFAMAKPDSERYELSAAEKRDLIKLI